MIEDALFFLFVELTIRNKLKEWQKGEYSPKDDPTWPQILLDYKQKGWRTKAEKYFKEVQQPKLNNI